MQQNIKKIFLLLTTVMLSVLIVSAMVNAASNLLAPGAPNPSVGTMKTLEDIYQRITAGTGAIAHTMNPDDAPGGTMHTLTDIYGAITPNDSVCDGTNAGTADCDPIAWSGVIAGSGDWATAKAYCENIANGYTRLPTASELVKAISQWRALDLTGPGGFTGSTVFWSGTENGISNAWYAYSNATNSIVVTSKGKNENSYYRCVR